MSAHSYVIRLRSGNNPWGVGPSIGIPHRVGQLMFDEVGPKPQRFVENGPRHGPEAVHRHAGLSVAWGDLEIQASAVVELPGPVSGPCLTDSNIGERHTGAVVEGMGNIPP